MKAATSFLATAASVLLVAMTVFGPADRALAGGEEEVFGSGLTDIGGTATETLREVFRDGAEEWLGNALILLIPESAAESDPGVWLELCTQFSTTFDTAVGNATTAALAYPHKAWTGDDLPKDWMTQVRAGRKFILYMAETGYKAYSDWAGFAERMKGYEADTSSMEKKINKIKPDFEKLDKLLDQFNVIAHDRKKGAAKKLKAILKKVKKYEDKTISNDMDVIKKYRELVEQKTKDDDYKPDAVRKKLEDAAKSMDETVKLCLKTFPGARGFAKDWAKNGTDLADDYKEAYNDFVEAAKPIMGDIPPIWAGQGQFDEWKYTEFETKLTAMRKLIEAEIARIEGIPTVD